jgi:membrane protease YdiL (CAAX protease family)
MMERLYTPKTPVPFRWPVLIFAMLYPSLLTWIYFTLLKNLPGTWQQMAFGVGKLIQFGLPVVWVCLIARRKLEWNAPTATVLGLALAIGGAELVAGLGAYYLWLKPIGIFTEPVKEMLAKLQGFGLDSKLGLVGLGVAYSLVHSLLEEYYWRWFVLRELPLKPSAALVVSSLAFAAHHVIVLAGYFGWGSVWTYLFTSFVAVGGLIFGWLYQQNKSLYAPWLAHACADAVIFIIGYDLLATQLR